MCVTRENLNKSAHWPESFIAEYYWTLHIMHRPVHPKVNLWMKKLVVLKIIDYVPINYVIVLSSVLFGYGTFICINTIDIIL